MPILLFLASEVRRMRIVEIRVEIEATDVSPLGVQVAHNACFQHVCDCRRHHHHSKLIAKMSINI